MWNQHEFAFGELVPPKRASVLRFTSFRSESHTFNRTRLKNYEYYCREWGQD